MHMLQCYCGWQGALLQAEICLFCLGGGGVFLGKEEGVLGQRNQEGTVALNIVCMQRYHVV